MERHVFRTNDIRGKMGIDIAIDDMRKLAYAICIYYREKKLPLSTVALARDGRTHSPALHALLSETFCELGVTVFDLGLCPTPVMNFMTHMLPVDMGLMVTASHNGPLYNGCKFIYQRRPVWGSELQEIAQIYASIASPFVLKTTGRAPMYDCTDSNNLYIKWLCAQFTSLHGLNVPLWFDCGNGVTGAVVPQLVALLGWQDVHVLYPEIDGTFPHHEADPTVSENMLDLRNAVQGLSTATALGVAFDGDGDRMGAVSAQGRLLTGDHLLSLFARSVLRTRPGIGVVYDIKCSSMVADIVRDMHGVAHMAPSGHAIIREYMERQHALLGGELSCHFFFADRYFGYDDGIYAALRLIELIQQEQKSLDELIAELPITCATTEWRIDCDEHEKNSIVQHIIAMVQKEPQVVEISLLDGIRVVTEHGWWLLRVSNTQPVICLRAEAATQSQLYQVILFVKKVLSREALWPHMKDHFDNWAVSHVGRVC